MPRLSPELSRTLTRWSPEKATCVPVPGKNWKTGSVYEIWTEKIPFRRHKQNQNKKTGVWVEHTLSKICTCSQPASQRISARLPTIKEKGLNDLGEKAGECLFLLQQAKDKGGKAGVGYGPPPCPVCAWPTRAPLRGLVVAALGRHAQRPPLCPSDCSPGGQATKIMLSQSLQFTPRLSLG